MRSLFSCLRGDSQYACLGLSLSRHTKSLNTESREREAAEDKTSAHCSLRLSCSIRISQMARKREGNEREKDRQWEREIAFSYGEEWNIGYSGRMID